MTKVSVIIPTYNRCHCIVKAIDSVVSQTFQDLEVIVVDDGSTDHTQSTLSTYINDKRIQYIYQENKGVSAARNTGIKLAQGDWVAFLDSDDQWLPKKLHKQIQLIETSSVDVGCVICNSRFEPFKSEKVRTSFENAPFLPVHPQGICSNISSILLTRFILFNQSAIIKKSYLEEVGGYNENLSVLEDYDLALKLSFICSWGYDTTPLLIYFRNTENSLSSIVTSGKENKIILQILKSLDSFLVDKYITVPPLLKKQIRYYNAKVTCGHTALAMYFFKIYEFVFRRSQGYPRPDTVGISFTSTSEKP